jgi:hypothetical protein
LCPPATTFTAEDKDMVIQLALQGEVHRLPQRLVDYRVMPSAHTDALYQGLKALNVKWWSAELSDEAQTRIRRAIRFDHRVAALDAIGAMEASARDRGTADLIASASRLLRACLRWALTRPLMERGSDTPAPSTNLGQQRFRLAAPPSEA